jgi:amino acid permease
MTQTGLLFGILVIVICLFFVICDLKFFTETKLFLPRSNWSLAASSGADP